MPFQVTKDNFIKNLFSRSNTKKIISILNNFVDSNTNAQELGTLFITKLFS
jgi:hypothetical protein